MNPNTENNYTRAPHEQVNPSAAHAGDATLTHLQGRVPLFILGFFDPEMYAIERCLGSATWAMRATVNRQIVASPADAYRVDDFDVEADAASRVVRCWVECRPTGMSRADLEARGDIVIDHHAPGDRGFGESRPGMLWAASSLGQVTAVIVAARDAASFGSGYGPILARLADSQTIARACVDHNLGIALSGAAVGVHPWAAVLVMALDKKLSALGPSTPVTADEVEAYIARVLAAREAVRAAHFIDFGRGVRFRDMTEVQVAELPTAASLAGEAYIARAPSRPGVPDTLVVGGLARPEAVARFMALARLAALRLPGEVLAKTPGGDGVYGDPARGFAGTYASRADVVIVARLMPELGDALARAHDARDEILARVAPRYARTDSPDDLARAVRLLSDALA